MSSSEDESGQDRVIQYVDASGADVLKYSELLQEYRGAMYPAKLTMKPRAMRFTNTRNQKVLSFQVDEISQLHWVLRSKGWCVKVFKKDDTSYRMDGFRDTDYDKLAAYIQRHFGGLKLEKKDHALKGWNYGDVVFNANTMEFRVDGSTAFEIPLCNISHAQTAKNEVAIEFHPNDDAPVVLTEMRFFVPSDSMAETDPVQEFFRKVMAKADVIQAAGDAITIFKEVQCLTPRGRYDIKIYPTFLQLHGKTFDYKIPYSTILRLFLLPHRDGRQMFFVVSLDPPIKQGQTRYHFLILLFNKDQDLSLNLALTDSDIAKHEGKLAKEMFGPEYEIISRIMKALVNKKITVPGSFLGHTGTQSIACSYRAATGALYPLERGFVFVHKPPLHIRFDEVSSVNFARSAGSTRSFDFDVETKAGVLYTFVGIEKEEYGKLYDFVQQKKLRVKNIGKTESKTVASSSENDSDNEDDHDAYLVKMKAEGRERTDAGGDEDEDEDESDEDFQPAGSASEPDDEYDSNPPSTESSDDEDEDSGGSGSETGAVPKPKKAPKKKSEKKGSDDEKKTSKPSKSKKETKSKKSKEKDADRPKRPLTAYFLWFNENRSKLKEEFPGLSVADIAKKAGEKWKEVKDRTKWEEKAVDAKKKYDVEMAEYNRKAGKASGSTATKPSPKKSAESFTNAKSKEFISESESSDSEDKPLKRPAKEDEDDVEMASASEAETD